MSLTEDELSEWKHFTIHNEEGIELQILNFHKRPYVKSDKKTNLIHKKLHLPEKYACL